MSGMLTKEFLYMKGQKRILLAILILAVLLSVTMLNQSHAPTAVELASFLGVLMGLLASVEVFNSAGADEKAKWNAYARSLPVGAVQVVGARYLFLLICTAVCTALGAVIELAVTGGRADGNVTLLLCDITSVMSILMCSIELPLFYRFGIQKANLVVILVFCLGPVLFSRLTIGGGAVTDAQFFAALRLVPPILLAVLAVSFFFSCRIYLRKEL